MISVRESTIPEEKEGKAELSPRKGNNNAPKFSTEGGAKV